MATKHRRRTLRVVRAVASESLGGTTCQRQSVIASSRKGPDRGRTGRRDGPDRGGGGQRKGPDRGKDRTEVPGPGTVLYGNSPVRGKSWPQRGSCRKKEPDGRGQAVRRAERKIPGTKPCCTEILLSRGRPGREGPRPGIIFSGDNPARKSPSPGTALLGTGPIDSRRSRSAAHAAAPTGGRQPSHLPERAASASSRHPATCPQHLPFREIFSIFVLRRNRHIDSESVS